MSEKFGCDAFLKALEELKEDPLQLDQSTKTIIEMEIEGIKIKITVG
jgi:hypothetical protein